jgi:hypothetical protein
LDGRIVQVVNLFWKSQAKNKIDFNRANDGVALAVLVDKFEPGDGAINHLLEVMDSDVEDLDNEDNSE